MKPTTAQPETHIEEWKYENPQFPTLMEFIHRLGQRDWAAFTADWHRSSHFLVARRAETTVGFLRFVIQPIGPDQDCPPVLYKSAELLEAKVMAFAVDPSYRRQGIGRQLQAALIEQARGYGCHQIRSHSSDDNPENHELKLSLGYGVHPVVRGNDRRGAYFVLPLRQLGR